MPRIVDHAKRRREIADALLSIVAEDGIYGATIRAVAARAGWSTGVINHYFSDRRDLLLGGMRRAAEVGAERQQMIGRTMIGRQALEAVLEENLPLDSRRLALSRIFVFFYAEAGVDPAVRLEIDGYLRGWRRQTEVALRAAQECGDIDTNLDPTMTSIELVALADGLGCHALFNDDVLERLRTSSSVRTWVNRLTHQPVA